MFESAIQARHNTLLISLTVLLHLYIMHTVFDDKFYASIFFPAERDPPVGLLCSFFH